MADLGYSNSIDSKTIPTPQEIEKEIKKGCPFLAIVGSTPSTYDNPNHKYNQGHWVVIIGMDDKGNNKYNIVVFDPDDGKSHTVPYDKTIQRR